MFLHKQTKGSAEVTERKGDSGQMLVNPFACYLSSSKNSSNSDKTFQTWVGSMVVHIKATGLESAALTHSRLKAPSHSQFFSTL